VIGKSAISGDGVNDILKRRRKQAGRSASLARSRVSPRRRCARPTLSCRPLSISMSDGWSATPSSALNVTRTGVDRYIEVKDSIKGGTP
jgi:hypothetical protein